MAPPDATEADLSPMTSRDTGEESPAETVELGVEPGGDDHDRRVAVVLDEVDRAGGHARGEVAVALVSSRTRTPVSATGTH
ncbi:hypothetical protein GCM10010178_34550 [Lentzea flava]|uniref:Uncharacterized protein n=1 Tax=Lentzea flava TaxID=103732 RepID=A0ABQ2UL76_9PSEU|nr:hypothetical protein GCM10010178_34550 [Lentzea flava]